MRSGLLDRWDDYMLWHALRGRVPEELFRASQRYLSTAPSYRRFVQHIREGRHKLVDLCLGDHQRRS